LEIDSFGQLEKTLWKKNGKGEKKEKKITPQTPPAARKKKDKK